MLDGTILGSIGLAPCRRLTRAHRLLARLAAAIAVDRLIARQRVLLVAILLDRLNLPTTRGSLTRQRDALVELG